MGLGDTRNHAMVLRDSLLFDLGKYFGQEIEKASSNLRLA